VTLREGLAIGKMARGGRRPFSEDAIQEQIVRGTWHVPTAGGTMTAPDGSTQTWTAVQANSEGWIENSALEGAGYLFASVDSPAERPALLVAEGDNMVYVNGEPRAGDPYASGSLRLPVRLRAGVNTFLFSCSRGRIRARLLPVTQPVALNTADSTLPDLVLGETAPQWGAVVVVNAADTPATGLRLKAAVSAEGGRGARTIETDLPAIPPMTIKKVGFRLAAPEGASANAALLLTLSGRDKSQTEAAEKLLLRVQRPNEVRKVTFVSDIDGSVQYYAVSPAQKPSKDNALILTLHGAGVEALGQIEAYGAPKDWATLVGPTNRRPYGFDWEDWGRLDALEVLDLAAQQYPHDPARVSLTGHSMGGHGTWSLGSLFPGRFAALGPSAGWISFASYTGGGPAKPTDETPMMDIFHRAASLSDTLAFRENLLQEKIYILHGDADDNVPVEQARMMRAQLAAIHHPAVQWHEQPGAGHWWDVDPRPGADCVDWPPMFTLLEQSRIVPAPAGEMTFVTADPAVSANCGYVRIEQQVRMMQPSTVRLNWDAVTGTLRGTTENVQRLTIDRALLPGFRHFVLDDHPVRVAEGEERKEMYLLRRGDDWQVMEKRAPSSEKSPERGGPFKQAFANRMVFVYGTSGTPEENAWAYAKARFDAETFLYRGNGSSEIVADRDFDAKRMRDRNVILYGNADTNMAWKVLLRDCPIQVRRGAVQVGAQTTPRDDLACLFLYPRRDTAALVGVVSGTGAVGFRLTDRLPYFLSGVALPDWTVATPDTLAKGTGGVTGAGFFGNDWRVETGDVVWAAGAVPTK
jgi:dienelactone hydrolase